MLKSLIILTDSVIVSRRRINLAKVIKQQELKYSTSSTYSKFDDIDGRHPWADQIPTAVVKYPVRKLPAGKVLYFNFDLAIEMGLLPAHHSHKLNKDLESKILEAFCIRIINEYDQKSGQKFQPSEVKLFPHMATRYLQLQHSNKQGKTSGDGRSIWNGFFKGNGKIWDVSSRGTGVTCLAPGSVESQKPIKTGDETFGYGCGLLELDELFGTALYSEIFHKHNISTERVLTIIDTGKGHGIGVRVGTNLFRPAHLFGFLKQNNYLALKKATDFLIERQVQNNEWDFDSNSKKRYDHMLEAICTSFAKFSARLDVDYIFTWLEWDGDNVLFNAGIIDYGSIRQFGIRHDQYRYDDVDRFSTNLNEQKHKARFLVQVFAQITEYLKSGVKPNLKELKNHPILKQFDEHFKYYNLKYKLYNIGFNRNEQEFLMEHHRPLVEKFNSIFKYFENQKTNKKTMKVADGVNKPAIFNMRNFLREYPKILKDKDFNTYLDANTLFDLMLTAHATGRDRKITERQRVELFNLQRKYKELIESARRYRSFQRSINDICERSQIINRSDRVTGNGIIMVVDKIMKQIKQGLEFPELQKLIESFIQSQVLLPKEGVPNPEFLLNTTPLNHRQILKTIFTIVRNHKDDI